MLDQQQKILNRHSDGQDNELTDIFKFIVAKEQMFPNICCQIHKGSSHNRHDILLGCI